MRLAILKVQKKIKQKYYDWYNRFKVLRKYHPKGLSGLLLSSTSIQTLSLSTGIEKSY